MPQQQQQQQGSDKSMDILWIMALVIGAIILVWFFGRVYITSAVFYARIYEIKAINFVFDALRSAVQSIGFSFPQTGLDQWLVYIQKNMGGAVGFGNLEALSTAVGKYTRYPLVLLMAVGGIFLYFKSPANKFRHTLTTTMLKKMEMEIWPQISPVVDLDLVKKKLDDEPWAVALSPMRFCKKYDLLDIEEKHGEYKTTLRRGAAYRVLSLQLGPKWNGLEALPVHLKALFAIFAARIENDKKGSENLLDQISDSASSSELDFSGVNDLLRKHVKSKKVSKAVSLHGYITTILASMLVGARSVGVIATSEFIWLKPIDRRMWYMLNSVGRATSVPEISGAFAHWLAEKRLGLPLMVPMVDQAVRGLEIAISEMIYKPEEED